MGIAASLFFSNTDSENCLAYRIKPAIEQRDAQKERWNDLRDILCEKLNDETGYNMSSWLQGSYKFGTQIRPARPGDEFDIDLGIYFEWNGTDDEGQYDPDKFKELVQDLLVQYADDETNEAEGVSDPKARCNRIHFSGDFHIDVPSYHLDRSTDSRSLATEENGWEHSDPKAIYVWWKDALDDAKRQRARRLVRYLKMWAALNLVEEDRPSSILLTVLACEAYLGLNEGDHSGDDEHLREVIKAILDRLRHDTRVPNPIDKGEDLNRLSDKASTNLISELDAFQSLADKALAAASRADSADFWSEAFHHFFPLPEQEELIEDANRNALAMLTFDPTVSVIATNNGRRWADTNRIGIIPRGSDISFSIMNVHELPAGAEVTWIVRNSGLEAEAINDMGHRGATGNSTTESSAYRGTHHMDVTVRLNGRVIGRRRIPVKVSGLGLPLRNPGRKGWVKLRSRGR